MPRGGRLCPRLIRLLGYSEFGGAGPLTLLLAPGYLLLQLYVFAPGFSIRERTDLQLVVSIVGAVSAVAFNYLFIRSFGLAGAGVATLLSSAIFLGAWFGVSQSLNPTVRWRQLFSFVGAAALAGAALAQFGSGTLLAIGAKLVLIGLVALAGLVFGLVRPREWGLLRPAAEVQP